MRTPAQGRATESDQSFLPLLTELLHPFPSHLALWIELPGAFSPPRDGGEDRSKEAKPTHSSTGLGGELEIPGLGPGAQSRHIPRPARWEPASLTWFWSLGGMERMVLLSTSPMRNSDTL